MEKKRLAVLRVIEVCSAQRRRPLVTVPRMKIASWHSDPESVQTLLSDQSILVPTNEVAHRRHDHEHEPKGVV
jgi:hypothetical protein